MGPKTCSAVVATLVALLFMLAPAATLARTPPAGGGPFDSQGSLRRLLTYTADASNCQVQTSGDYLDCGSSTPACCTSSTCYYNPTGAQVARSASQSSSSSSASASSSSSSEGDSSSASASSSSEGDSNEPGVCADSFYLGCC